jgi:hypothetical protein
MANPILNNPIKVQPPDARAIIFNCAKPFAMAMVKASTFFSMGAWLVRKSWNCTKGHRLGDSPLRL